MVSISEAVTRSNDRPSDPRNQQVVHPANSPENGNLATPINSSTFSLRLINNLSAYRPGLLPVRRGLEVGIAHALVAYPPFAKLGPLRNTATADLVGLLSTIGLVIIMTASLSLYAASHPPAPHRTLTTPNPPKELSTPRGWNQYASGFLVGGLIGSVIAYFIFVITGW